MPAAKPSKPALENAISAAIAHGLTPTAIVVDAAGGFRIELNTVATTGAETPSANDGALPTWDDVA